MAARDPYENFVIQRDTREKDKQYVKNPSVYEFNAQYELPKAYIIDGCMTVGDYGIWSPHSVYQYSAAVERKTLPDLIASICDRRLDAQADKLFELEYGAVVIEASWATIIDGNHKGGYKFGSHESKMRPQAVAGFILKLQMEKGLTVMPAVNRVGAEYWTYKFLRRAYINLEGKRKAVPEFAPDVSRAMPGLEKMNEKEI